MSVYTHLSFRELEQFLSLYTTGSLIRYEGIADGIENTNYAVTTDSGDFILTIFETLPPQKLILYLDLLQYLSAAQIPCPQAQTDKNGERLHTLQQKPAALFKRLPGIAVLKPSIAQCRDIGRQLAILHSQSRHYRFERTNPYDFAGCQNIFADIADRLNPRDAKLIADELHFQSGQARAKLPKGTIHGDLFKDNVLFNGDSVSAILDFYSACHDTLLLDLAITVNDWCVDNGTFDPRKAQALNAGYQQLRPLLPEEQRYWPALLRAAALRFWLSRLRHQLYPRAGELTSSKDPNLFRRLLCHHRKTMQTAFYPQSEI